MEANSSIPELTACPGPLLVLPVLLSLVWALYELFYAPRVIAFFITKLANLFMKDSGLYIRSVRIHLLTGRIVFKDAHYYTRDFSLRAFDGYLSLRWWWKTGKNACRSCDRIQRTAPFLNLRVNGLEWHWYNRSDVYNNWGLEKEEISVEELTEPEESSFSKWWNSLQPSIHISIRRGRVLLGNHLIERTVAVYFATSESHYSITEASNHFDERMSVLSFDTRKVRIVLEPSVGYKGPKSNEKPPVLCEGMDDAYLFLKTDDAILTYYLDSPGIVPLGDNPPPKFAFDVKLGTNSVINYSCYSNRERHKIMKVFFPNDHREQPVNHLPEPGQKRVYTMFSIFIEATSCVSCYQLFSDRHGKLSHLAISAGAGSKICIHQPWVYAQEGQLTVVKGNLRNVKVTSSLDYQSLGSADTLDFQADLQFPRLWNATQTWTMRFSGDTVQANVLFAYIDFINDLLDDWVGDDSNDLLTFVPLDWSITVDLTRYEIFLFTNRYNWVDIAMDGAENTRLALCGTSGRITLAFPFNQFNPPEQEVHFKAVGENIVVRRYVPPSCTTRHSLFSLSSLNKHRWRSMTFAGDEPKVTEVTEDFIPQQLSPIPIEVTSPAEHVISAPIIGELPSPTKLATFRPPSSLGHTTPIRAHHSSIPDLCAPDSDDLPDRETIPMGYRGVTQYRDGWLDFASGPSITITIDYTGHGHDKQPGRYTRLHPNVMNIGVEVPTVLFRVFGFLGRDIWALIENYPGEYINFKTFNSNIPTPQSVPERPHPPHLVSAPPPDPPNEPNEPKERTLWMYLDFRLKNVTAEFPTHLPKGWPRDFPLPSLTTDEFCMKMEFTNKETLFTMLVEPLSVHIPTKVPEQLRRSCDSDSVNELGHVTMSGLCLRAHGFTELFCQERVEYAWLLSLDLGRIAGTVSTLQLTMALDWFLTAFTHTASFGDGCRPAPGAEVIEPKIEPISEKIKYRLFSMVIEEGDLFLADGDVLTRIQTPGFDLCFCGLHSEKETLGMSFQLHGAMVTTFAPTDSSCVVESGVIDLGPISGDLSLREPEDCVPNRQLEFLKLADKQTKRLWFLWDNKGNCGCWGGCLFHDDFIKRPLTQGKKESAIYNSQITTQVLDSLESNLSSQCIRELDCLQTIHKGLLEHYQCKYTPPAHIPPSKLSRPQSNVSDMDDESFVSAHGSISSLMEAEFVSVEDLSAVATKLKGKPTALNLDAGSGVKADERGQETYRDVSNTHTLSDTRLRVCMDTQVVEEGESHHFSVKRTRSEGAARDPKTTPKKLTPARECLVMRLPQLSLTSIGQVPSVISRGTMMRSKDRSRGRVQVDKDYSLATFSLGVSVVGPLKVVLTPAAATMVHKLLDSLHHWFSTRSHLAIMDALSHVSLDSLRDHYTQLHTSNTSAPPHPFLHLSVAMETQSSLAIQLLQIPKKVTQIPTELRLKEITHHMSLINIFVSGLKCQTLFQTARDVGGASKRILSSMKILGKVNLPVIQASICCLLPKYDLNKTLPTLPLEQSQLAFELSTVKDLSVCTLLEAGLKDIGVTLVAKLLATEVHEDAVLDWTHIRQYGTLDSVMPTHAVESKNNHFVLDIVMPRVWSQVASTHTGIAGPVTGGLDLLIMYEAMEAWLQHVGDFPLLVNKLFSDKSSRDRKVLLTIVANAARNSMMFNKSFNPVHSDVTLALRNSVVYACLQQLWQTLPAFSENMVPQNSSTSFESELVATLLAISARIYSLHEEGEKNCLSQPPVEQNGVSDKGSVGYISISPSPSELAIPNIFVADFLDLRDMDYEPVFSKATRPSLLALREALLPFFNTASLEVPPQLRPVCHNKNLFEGKVSMALKEISVFVTLPSHSHTRHKDTPVFHAKHIKWQISLQYTTETTTPDSDLSLLPSNTTKDVSTAKINVASSCVVSVEEVSFTLTMPLLKLGRHMMETAQFRSHVTKLSKIFNEDNLATPRAETTSLTPAPEHFFIPRSEISIFTQSIATIVKSREVKGETTPPTSSLVGGTGQSPKDSSLPSPEDPSGHFPRPQSPTSSLTSDDVAIVMENSATSPDVVSDTVGDDTQDSLHVTSNRSLKPLTSRSYPTLPPKVPIKDNTSFVLHNLSLPSSQLLFSVFGLLRVKHMEASAVVETTKACLSFDGVSTSVDIRKSNKEIGTALPTYLSAALTMKKSSVVLSDSGLPDPGVLLFEAHPVYASGGMCGGTELPTYRCIVKVPWVKLSIPQSPVIIHRRYQMLMPVFKNLYQDVFAKNEQSQPSTPSAPMVDISSVKIPPKLPQGFVHMSLDNTTIDLSPLPSLTVTYSVIPVVAQLETTNLIHFELSVGDHIVRFSPRDPHKDDLLLRSLPHLSLKGRVQGSRLTMHPSVSLELSVKQVIVDITTDVLNQLLVLQNSFIKEVNDLIQLFTGLGSSMPRRRRPIKQEPDNGPGMLSFIESCHLSLSGIQLTISTPLSMAIRFVTGKIEMSLVNTSPGDSSVLDSISRNQFQVMGRVDIDINASLGSLQDNPDDELLELAYFKMRVSLRNTIQSLSSNVDRGDEPDLPLVVDTFAISILNPHLYLQSSAVEQGILFWVNCNSVYNYWQNERKKLNAEVQAATEELMQKIQYRPTQSQTPSIDFSKPRLVKLTVSDVGVCMPLTPMSSTPHSAKSQSFPAMVITIKEMQFQLNLSRKIASTGNFDTLCIRFAEQFYLRQKTWTLDPRKHLSANYGSIHHGTFRLCIANQKRVSEADPRMAVGEKLLFAFQWDMSGIEVIATKDIGRHTSTIVRTITLIGTDLDGSRISKAHSSNGTMSNLRQLRRPVSVAGPPHHSHRRSKSTSHRHDNSYMATIEAELAKQTRKIQSLKSQGASAEVLQVEKEILKSLQNDLGKAMRRFVRQPKASVAQWFTPRPQETEGGAANFSQGVIRQLFNQRGDIRDPTPSPTHMRRRAQTMPSSRHKRFKSDLTGMKFHQPDLPSSPSPSVTPTPHEKEPFDWPEGEDGGVVREEEGFTLPTIDVEVDFTFNVDHGKIVLRTEESQPLDRRASLPTLNRSPIPHRSPHTRVHNKPLESFTSNAPILETVILIPALTVKAHYQSIVGRSYSNALIPRSPSQSPPSNSTSNPLPVKKGVLSISAVIASLPEPLRLSPSLLEFIEQVARPTIAATIVSSSSSTDSEEESFEANPTPSSDSWPLSFPVDVTLAFQILPSTLHLTCQPHSLVECVIQSPNVNFVISFSLFTPQDIAIEQTSPVGSGAGVGNDSKQKILMFNNLYITACLTTFILQLLTPPVSSGRLNVGSGVEKKDALSLTLGQALIHFSRKSVSYSQPNPSTACSVDDYAPSSKLQVSVAMHIASVVGGYDMRRLNDITAFRRHWYRTSLVEAIFIGTKSKMHDEVGGVTLEVAPPEGSEREPSAVMDMRDTISAVIVVAANVEDLRVSTNVAQVMGNTDLVLSQLRCEAHCDVQHNELILLEMDSKLEKWELDARGGVIAGNVLIQGAHIQVTTQSAAGIVPVHKCSASLELIEGRVDYMSSCSLLARTNALNLELSDSWEGLNFGSSEKSSQFASVKINAKFTWDKLQLAIHRSTTKSLFNMVQKMHDFIMQQKRRSERTISLMLPAGSAASKALKAYREEKKRIGKEEEAKDKGFIRHHWLWAMRVGSVELMKTMGIHTQATGQQTVSLGAEISVLGNNFCLVCFHGPSFRETEWAVFNIDAIKASFSTQAIPGLGKGQSTELTEGGSGILPAKQVRTCQQIVHLSLGNTPWEETSELDELAAIYRVSASHTRPPNIVGTSTVNWLNYACVDAQLHPNSYAGDTTTLVRLSKKLNLQSILLIPAFQVELVTDHFWPQRAGMSAEDIQLTPKVECSLTSSFATGISVTTNVDHYLFLHDLVKAYLEYLEKHKAQSLETGADPPESTAGTDPLSPPPPTSTSVYRNFECVCWELDPALRLLSSAGTGQFNPHISWLLERLGFKHAQTTIPKWIQRVAMDPLDMVVANAMEMLIKITATKKLQLQSRASSPPSHI